jgi:DNA-binding response OmpR family regulator
MTHTILIVDDDEPTQKLLEALLSRGGLQSLVAPNGHAAIETLDGRDDIACVILDMMMPKVDGHSVLEHVRNTKNPVPVIVCTALGPAMTDSLDPIVVRAVIRKPFDIDHLMETVNALIASR